MLYLGHMNRKISLVFILFAIAVVGVIAAIYLASKNYQDILPETVVDSTIASIDPGDPDTFWNIQAIIDLGEDAVNPLVDRADSDDLLTQWINHQNFLSV